MAKNFAPRVSKKNRKSIDLSDRLSTDLLKLADEKLLRGAILDEVALSDILVKEQVRTKFNDSSIKELAENIRVNGLIQPLVLHRKDNKFTLICGERRFRAMSSIAMKTAPCFILENKTQEELMAIQFSENSSREALHYIDKADGILNYQKATNASERKIQAALGTSKSEVHRSLLIAKLPSEIKEAAKIHNIEKYVLIEFDAIEDSSLKKQVREKILEGSISKRSQLKRILSTGVVKVSKKRQRKSPTLPKGLTANAFLKAMKSKSKDMNLDKKSQEMLEALLKETKEMVDF